MDQDAFNNFEHRQLDVNDMIELAPVCAKDQEDSVEEDPYMNAI